MLWVDRGYLESLSSPHTSLTQMCIRDRNHAFCIGLYANYSIWMQREQVAGMEKIWVDIW